MDASVHYVPKVPFAEVVVAHLKQKYPRLLGLKIYANKEPGLPVVIADLNDAGIGEPGSKYDEDVISSGVINYLKDRGAVEVTLPLRDRNGEIAAALKTRMKAFPGETQSTAVARAATIRKAVEAQTEAMENITK